MKTEIRFREHAQQLSVKYTLRSEAQTLGIWACIEIETAEGRVTLEGPQHVLADALRTAAKTANRLTPVQDFTDGHGT